MSGLHPHPRSWTAVYATLHETGRAVFPPACLHYVLEVVRRAARHLPHSYQALGARSEMNLKPELNSTSHKSEAFHIENSSSMNKSSTLAHTLSAPDVITAFRTAVRTDFGPLRNAVLEEWGILTPADLGRAVSVLGSVGCLNLDDGDSIEFYAAEPSSFLTESQPATQIVPNTTLPSATVVEQESP
jgi:uncharacterized repeat protein (TIGR04138 family)